MIKNSEKYRSVAKWTRDLLERGIASRNETLLAFWESGENQQAPASVIGNGFAYTPPGA